MDGAARPVVPLLAIARTTKINPSLKPRIRGCLHSSGKKTQQNEDAQDNEEGEGPKDQDKNRKPSEFGYGHVDARLQCPRHCGKSNQHWEI